MDDSEWDIDSFDKITLSDDSERKLGRNLTAAAALEQVYVKGTKLDQATKQKSTGNINPRLRAKRNIPQHP